ncbi:unnamed protein product [Schistosoma margrebowiei]|uniref:Uncharacterized protein n=1 Tax=Schistosoma margrebowiei TaxID=48269 RepID=A0A183M623_9TREM|nr:unnamed protein product [Schistosoma margrebowiei]
MEDNWTTEQTALQRFNTAFLRDTDRLNEFKIALNNRFQALQDLLKEEETTTEDNWKGIKEALASTCQEVLILKKHHHKEWISIETLDKIKERKNKKAVINNSRTRAEKIQAQVEHIEASKQMKKSIIADKQKYVEELAKTAEKAAGEGNMKKLYDTTKKLAGRYTKPERPVKDKEGKLVTEIQQQRNRWVEYFEEHLNRPVPMNSLDLEAAHTDLPIDVNPPTKEEIKMATKQIKRGKAAGPDNIPADALNIIDGQGGSDSDVKARIGKARFAFLQLKNIWNSKQLSTNIKVRIFNINVKAVLLYGAETWRTTTTTIKKVQVFINSCLRKILNIHWPDTISNSLL